MTQFILECPNELINYIDNIDITKCNTSKHLNIQLTMINPKCLNVFMTQTIFPTALIEIINEYICDKFEMQVIRNCCEVIKWKDCNDIHAHFYLSLDNANINFNTYSFDTTYCIKNNCVSNKVCYKSLIQSRISDDDVVKIDIFYRYYKSMNVHACHNELKIILEDPDTYFNDNKDRTYKDKIYSYENDFECFDTVDTNLFFNCYFSKRTNNSNDTYYGNNIIENDLLSVKLCKNCALGTISASASACKYYEKDDCYKQIVVGKFNAEMIQYTVLNHEKLMTIIGINKLLFEIINKQMKQICKNSL